MGAALEVDRISPGESQAGTVWRTPDPATLHAARSCLPTPDFPPNAHLKDTQRETTYTQQKHVQPSLYARNKHFSSCSQSVYPAGGIRTYYDQDTTRSVTGIHMRPMPTDSGLVSGRNRETTTQRHGAGAQQPLTSSRRHN
ncbi:hypothetical protein Bbelb_088530 [Branchiostoma belcheri]|nr:hypothetical protein Bbelb_088530 [Branchiostoma belcheri]